MKRRQLLLDVSLLHQRDHKTGIHRVVWSILQELVRHPPAGLAALPIYATANAMGYRYAGDFARAYLGNEHINHDIVSVEPGDIFFGLDFHCHILQMQYSLLTEWHQRGVEIQFLVYDLLPILKPGMFDGYFDLWFQQWLEMISQFNGVVCISRSVADEYYEWLQAHRPKRKGSVSINWTHLGADVENYVKSSPPSEEVHCVLDRFSLRPTFIMVGTIEPRKGHIQTLKAFTRLWEEGHDVNLVIIGKKGWKYAEILSCFETHPELGKRFFWLSQVGDEDLVKMYASSICLIAASIGEGFGLPLIEAAKYRLPIIARDMPVFREVADGHAYFFKDNSNPGNLAKAIVDWLNLYRMGQHPKSENMPFLTWKESVANLLDAIMDRKCYRQWSSIYPFCVLDKKLNRARARVRARF